MDELEPTEGAVLGERHRAQRLRVVEVHERLDGQPAARAPAPAIASTSATVSAIGFSHRTCLPASSARIVHGAWRWFGSGT